MQATGSALWSTVEIGRCRKLDCGTREAPMAGPILPPGFLGEGSLEFVVMGERLVASRGLVGRTLRPFALDERNRRERIGNALDRGCFAGIDREGIGIDRWVDRRESLGDRVVKSAYRRRPSRE